MKTRDPGAPQSDAPLRQKRSNGACRHSGISGAEMDTHAEGGARRTPNPVHQIAQKLSFGGSWDTVDRSGRRVPGSHLSWWRTDCVAGHVRLELRNVVANYPFESSRGFMERRAVVSSEPKLEKEMN